MTPLKQNLQVSFFTGWMHSYRQRANWHWQSTEGSI